MSLKTQIGVVVTLLLLYFPIATGAQSAGERPEREEFIGERLSVNFQDIEVRSVLQLLADFSGQDIVLSDRVGGNITLRLNNVPWDQALDMVLKARGLDMRVTGGVMYVTPTEEVTAREFQNDGPRFIKLGPDGRELAIQDADWVDRGNEVAGTQWRCVRDPSTGLTWEVKTRDNWRELYNFTQAVALARNANLCGLSGWRIPSSSELLSLVEHNALSGPKIDRHHFNYARGAFHWSNEVYEPYPAYAVGVHFGSGVVSTANQSARSHLRLVHGGR